VSIVFVIPEFFPPVTECLTPALELLGKPFDNLFGVLYCSYLESFLVDPKQYGDTYASRRRRAGMQTQKMPVKASRTDQYAVGTLSYVGFVEDENWTRDCRRMMEIRVVLELWLVLMSPKDVTLK
jgi:hypothetical protein